MVAYRLERLPDEAIDAAALFYAEHAKRIPRALWHARTDAISPDDVPDGITVIFPLADHTHQSWRLAAIQQLAREVAPLRVNAIVGTHDPDIELALAYLADAPGVTGQVLELDGNPAKVD
jgi:hypothetical protein